MEWLIIIWLCLALLMPKQFGKEARGVWEKIKEGWQNEN